MTAQLKAMLYLFLSGCNISILIGMHLQASKKSHIFFFIKEDDV